MWVLKAKGFGVVHVGLAVIARVNMLLAISFDQIAKCLIRAITSR